MSQKDYKKFQKLNDKFTADFTAAFNKIGSPDKNELFYYFDNIYRVWYYSALFYDGYATPAAFAGLWYGESDFCIPCADEKGIKFVWKQCSINEHYFIKDLSLLARIADEGAVFDDITREMLPDDFALYAKEFTFADNIYIAYLTETALELGLIKRLPAIRVARYASTAKGRSMEQLPTDIALEKVTESAAKIFCRKFSAVLGNCPGLNKALVYEWLNKSVKTDDIYADIYGLAGYDIIDLWQKDRSEDDTLDENEKAALSSVYPIGRLIDRYFLTPFGRYLQFIQPLYYRPVNFAAELKHIFSTGIRDDFDNSYAVFLPSSVYKLTALGEKMFKESTARLPFTMTGEELETSLERLMKLNKQ